MLSLLILSLVAAPASVEVVFDAAEQTTEAKVDNAMDLSVRASARASGIVRPGFQLHPDNARPATITWQLALPALKPGERLVLAGFGGLSDGVQPEKAEMDGIGFGVVVDGRRLCRVKVDEPGWVPFCFDLAEQAGKTVELALFTDDGEGRGNCSFDWALFGQTRIYKLAGNAVAAGRTDVLAGVVLADHPGAGPAVAVRIQPLDAAGQPIGGAERVDLITGTGHTLVEYDVTGVPGAASAALELDGADGELTAAPFAPAVELVSLGPARGVVFAGDKLTGRAVIKNTGRGAVTPEHQLTLAFAGAFGGTRTVDRLAPGEELTVSVAGGGAEAGEARLALGLSYTVGGWPKSLDEQRVFTVWPARLPLPAEPVTGTKVGKVGAAGRWTAHYLANEALRTIFWGSGAGPVEFQAVVGGKYKTVAMAPSVAELQLVEGGQPREWDAVSTSHDTLQFEIDAPPGKLTCTYRAEAGSSSVAVHVRYVAEGAVGLLALRGPALLVGDGTTGGAKQQAIFPGLEYLEAGEPSSSTRDFDPPLHLRLVPDPYKITVPCMAVETADATVAVSWDPLRPWHGRQHLTSALFASPNFVDGQDNHRLQVFVPGGVDLVAENHLTADPYYNLPAGEPISVAQRITLLPGRPLLDAIDDWIVDRGELPEPENAPRDQAAELELCRWGFTRTVWDAEAKKSKHCVGWANLNAPQYAPLLLFDSVVTGSAEARAHAQTIIDTTLAEEGERGLNSSNGCHIMRNNAPFFYGHLDGALEAMRQSAYGAAGSMSPEGAWGYRPSDDMRFLGAAGATELGTCAPSAYAIWRWMRFSGDRALADAGRQALAYMDRFVVPAGAQGWECPIHEPDILAAAYAVRAFLEAYRVTGHKPYLERAVYWARTGVPFNYLWGDPGFPGMTYASIPVFGSTFRTHSWLGLPVQWCGLVYAYAILQLAEVDETMPWETIARGLTVSAMYQQHGDESPELKGCYPDSWAFVAGRKNGPHINPEDIQVCLLALAGHDPEPNTVRWRIGGQTICLTTGATIVRSEVEGNTGICWLERPADLTTYAVVPGIGRPGGITIGGRPASLGDDIDAAGVDACYDPAQAALFLKVSHDEGPVEVRIGGLRPGSPPEPPRRAAWRFTDGPGGWTAENHCEVKAAGGHLVCTVTGIDPYMGTADAWFAAADHPTLTVRARTTAGRELALFWGTNLTPGTSPERELSAPLPGDGQWHEVTFDLRGKPGWAGMVNYVRLDPEPADVPAGTALEIEWIRAGGG